MPRLLCARPGRRLREEDLPALARAACHEAHVGYPVPRDMTQEICEQIIRAVLPPADASPMAPAPAAAKAPPKKPAAKKVAAKKTPRAAR